MGKNTRNMVVGTLIFAAVISLAISGSVSAASSDAGHPSAKATCKVADITLIDGTTQQGWTTLLSNTIKTANKKDLFIDVSLECGLYTQTLVKSKGGSKDTSKAEAVIKVRVLVDDVPAYPGEVVFSSRMQELSATLEGMIGDCLTIDPEDPNHVIVDLDCVTPEEIELILNTMTANSFNFVENDLSSGVHKIAVQAMIGTTTSAQEGTASATATIGKGTVIVEEVRLIKDEDIVLE